MLWCTYFLSLLSAIGLLLRNATAASSFSLNQNDGFFTFSYSTDSKNAKNWIGIYKTSGGGPDNEKFVEESLNWDYTPEDKGTIHIPAGKLPDGQYKAYFLKDGGYKWLANPITVTIPRFESSFSVRNSDPSKFTFDYKTTGGNDRNWIGIYPRNEGPLDQVFEKESLKWAYAPGNSGFTNVNVDSLDYGNYDAFYLQRDGYRRLAGPLSLSLNVPKGSFSWSRNDNQLRFEYSVNEAYSNNWIGIYPQNEGPVDEVFVKESLTWVYAPFTSGSVTINVGDLPGGNYKAFFLGRDRYKWIAKPIDITIAGLRFPIRTATLRNARRGTFYEATVRGLLIGDLSRSTFSKISGDSWVSVSNAGIISGTPGSSSGDASITIRATGGGASADMTVNIPVRPAGSCMVQDVRVMTYNMWYGGKKMKAHHEKQLRAILDANVDIVTIQEGDGNDQRPLELAFALGWSFWKTGDGKKGIISRYPIQEAYPSVGPAIAARIAFDGSRQEMNVWNAHLNAYPYGPYSACFKGKSVSSILADEENGGDKDGSNRGPQIRQVLDGMASHIKSSTNIPVILSGDFNAPSHLDWVSSTRNRHCGYSVGWPTSKEPISRGLKDSYRVAHPDPSSFPGDTWSPIVLRNEDEGNRPEPQDRIDFIYFAGNIQVLSSSVYQLGIPAPQPNVEGNEWTSDHRAVVTTFRLNSGTC